MEKKILSPYRSILVLFFSGTGNTEAITNLIVSEFRKNDSVTAKVMRVEDVLRQRTRLSADKYDLIGIGYPIYGFAPPANIFKLLKSFDDVKCKKFFIYSTCAGPFYFNDIAAYGLKKKIKKEEGDIVYEKQFYMPPNIAIRYSDNLAKQLYNSAIVKSARMVSDILSGINKVRDDGILPFLFQWTYTVPERMGFRTLPLDFKVLMTCNLCGRCIELCPQENISCVSKKIKFGLNCLACYRCVYNCPNRSIIGRLYKFAILKDGYNIEKIIKNNRIKGDYVNSKTKGYYKVFYEYLEEDHEKKN